jgi:hypothetical protein
MSNQHNGKSKKCDCKKCRNKKYTESESNLSTQYTQSESELSTQYTNSDSSDQSEFSYHKKKKSEHKKKHSDHKKKKSDHKKKKSEHKKKHSDKKKKSSSSSSSSSYKSSSSEKKHSGPFGLSSTRDGPFGLSSTRDGPFGLSSTRDGPFGLSSTRDGPKKIFTSSYIMSCDKSSSVSCLDCGKVQIKGCLNLHNNSINGVTHINGSSACPLIIAKCNAEIKLDNNLISETICGKRRFYADDSITYVNAPDGLTGLSTINNSVTLTTNAIGTSFFCDTVQTFIKYGTTKLTLNTNSITANAQFIIPSGQNPAAPDIRWVDSTNTGFYSRSTGSVDVSCSGLNVLHVDPNNYVLISSGILQQIPASLFEVNNPTSAAIAAFYSHASQTNLILARANGSSGSETRVNIGDRLGNIATRGWTNDGALTSGDSAAMEFYATENFTSDSNRGSKITLRTSANGTGFVLERMVVDHNGFVGINVPVPSTILHIAGSSGATFRMVDNNQGLGKLMVSSATGVGTWTSTDAVAMPSGFIYYEPGIGSLTTFVFGAMSTQYLINPVTVFGLGTNFDMPANARLRYTGTTTRTIACNINLSFTNSAGITTQQIYFWPRKNGVNIVGASTTGLTGTSTTDFNTISLCFSVSMITNDYIELYASNESLTTGINVHSLQIRCT